MACGCALQKAIRVGSPIAQTSPSCLPCGLAISDYAWLLLAYPIDAWRPSRSEFPGKVYGVPSHRPPAFQSPVALLCCWPFVPRASKLQTLVRVNTKASKHPTLLAMGTRRMRKPSLVARGRSEGQETRIVGLGQLLLCLATRGTTYVGRVASINWR